MILRVFNEDFLKMYFFMSLIIVSLSLSIISILGIIWCNLLNGNIIKFIMRRVILIFNMLFVVFFIIIIFLVNLIVCLYMIC